MAITEAGKGAPSVLSHELGHVLGLNHVDFAPNNSNSCGGDNLMCAKATAQTQDLSAGQCSTAHINAEDRQEAYW